MSNNKELVPVLDLAQEASTRIDDVVQHFRDHFRAEPDFAIRVPGRVNLIGEHIDYCGYAVFPMAVERDIVMAVSKNDTGRLNLTNIQHDLYADFGCNVNDFAIAHPPRWHDYFLAGLKGVVEQRRTATADHHQSRNGGTAAAGQSPQLSFGLDVVVSGSLPPSSGLSSSSALVCAAAVATEFAFGSQDIDKTAMANLCAAAERFIGTQGGGMDQAIAFLAERGSAKLIEFVPSLRSHSVKMPAGAHFFVSHSGASCNKGATDHYNTRVLETKSAAFILARHFSKQTGGGDHFLAVDNFTLGNVQQQSQKSLFEMAEIVDSVLKKTPYSKLELFEAMDVQSEEEFMKVLAPNNPSAWTRFASVLASTEQFKLRDRALHVYEEAARVHHFKKVCDSQLNNQEKLKQLGELMDKSHASCRDLYECSCPELDRLIAQAKKAGARGARLTGAGWGGCIVALVEEHNVDNYKNEMQIYSQVTKSFTFDSKPGPGVAVYTLPPKLDRPTLARCAADDPAPGGFQRQQTSNRHSCSGSNNCSSSSSVCQANTATKMDLSLLPTQIAKHPKSNSKPIQYGTAGFRTKATELNSVVFRIGLVAALRSKHKHGQAIGIMITASHNPKDDNGVKIIDPLGEMLATGWEAIATKFANVDDSDLGQLITVVAEEEKIDPNESSTVLIAYDTRESSVDLAEAASDGVAAIGAAFTNLGLLTTPQLHYIVRCRNDKTYGQDSEQGYNDKLSKAFNELNGADKVTAKLYRPTLRVDCANGIGAQQLAKLLTLIQDRLQVQLFNCGEGELNHNCGADFVKLNQKAPIGTIEPSVRYASLDGDADRIVYFYTDANDQFHLLDGDKIALLYVVFLKKLLDEAQLADEIKLCLIQTAYANGSSTRYAESIGVETACTPTGVKHLHHRALQSDVAIYFEANGHGTCLFSDKAIEQIEAAAAGGNAAASRLAYTVALINQTTGDAISDLLLVETILRDLDWSVETWAGLYTDLPSRQLKVTVSDRNLVTTADAERKAVTPEGLQESIDAYARKLGPNARCFVRPSGTEDIVRVYAEAETQEKADTLAEAIANAVTELVDASYGGAK